MLWQHNSRVISSAKPPKSWQLQKVRPLARSRAAIIAALVGIYFAACSTVEQKYGDEAWYQKSKEASAKAVEVTTTTATKAAEVTSTTASKAYTRMQQYLAEKDVLKTFYDAGEHSETAVLSVLHKSGIAKPAATPPPGGKAGPPKHTAPPPLTTVPNNMRARCDGRWMPT
jgi:hypothetical protein